MASSILKIESYKKGIVLSVGFNVISKALAFVTNLVIAYYFGTQSTTDVYFYCLATVLLMAGFITSLNSSVIIPESMRLNAQQSKEEAMLFLNTFLYIFILIGIVSTVFLILNPVSFFSMISKFDIQILQANSKIVIWTIPLFLLMVLTSYLTDILTSYKFFTVPILISIINSIVSLLFLWIFHQTLGIRSILIGLLIAYVFHLSFLIYLLISSLQWRFSLRFAPIRKATLKNIFFALSGNITSSLSAYVPLFLLSGFSQGIITSLNYGQRIADLPNLLIIGQFSAIAGIKFNELYAQKDWDKMNSIFLSGLKFLSFILIPMSFFTAIYSNELIAILFQRGAFNQNSVDTSGMFLKYLSFLFPLLAVNTLVSRLFMASQKIMESVFYQILFNFVLIYLIYLGIKFWGPIGFPLGLLALHVINIIASYYLLKYFFPVIRYNVFLIYLVKVITFNIPFLLGLFYFKQIAHNLNLVLNLVSGLFFYTTTILILNKLVQLNPELNDILAKGYAKLKFYFFKKSPCEC
jgi:peptidoglycan biosynthesis protein MviN/MurJ (putative lipid II flippase)